MTGARRTGGDLCRCRFVPDHVTREKNDDTAASAHDQRHDRSWPGRQHQGVLPQVRHRAGQSLRPQPREDFRQGGPGLPHLSPPEEGVELAKLQLRSSWHPIPVPNHARQAGPALLPARGEDAVDLARDPQPRRTGAIVHGHHQPQASRDTDDGLCRGAARERTRPVAPQRYRLEAHVSARRPGQGQQGPVRPPLAAAARTAARVLAPQTARALAVPERATRTSDDPPRDRTYLPRSEEEGRNPQGRRHSYLEALFPDPAYSGAATGGWRRAGSLVHRFRNNHRLFRKASTSSSGRYRAGRRFEGVVLAIASSFSFRSACR